MGSSSVTYQIDFLRQTEIPIIRIRRSCTAKIWSLCWNTPQGTHLLTWIEIKPSMDKWLYRLSSVGGHFFYPFWNFKNGALEVWLWLNDFIRHFTGHVIQGFNTVLLSICTGVYTKCLTCYLVQIQQKEDETTYGLFTPCVVILTSRMFCGHCDRWLVKQQTNKADYLSMLWSKLIHGNKCVPNRI